MDIDIKHINQTCGSSCGPTSLKMLMSAVGYKNDLGIQDIFSMAKTKVGGAPWYRMARIISDLNIRHKIFLTDLDYFKNKPSNLKWMLAVYYANEIKHWVVLSDYTPDINKFLILDPAGDKKYISESKLKNMFYPRNKLCIEFDMDNFTGVSKSYSYDIMDIVDDNELRLNLDSNWIFGLKGELIDDMDSFDTNRVVINRFDNYDVDYTYVVTTHDFDRSKYFKNVFAYNDDMVILIKFKNLDIYDIFKLSRSYNIYL